MRRCSARRSCATSVRSARPELTIHQPTIGSSANRPVATAIWRAERPLEAATAPEPQGGQDEGRADQAGEQAMAPLPVEDGLEPIEGHVRVERGELRDLPIAREFLGPVGLAERRNHAGHGLPLRDRQAGFGEPSRPADDHHHEDQRRDREEPRAHGARSRRVARASRRLGSSPERPAGAFPISRLAVSLARAKT